LEGKPGFHHFLAGNPVALARNFIAPKISITEWFLQVLAENDFQNISVRKQPFQPAHDASQT
jgi:hypothetical protein